MVAKNMLGAYHMPRLRRELGKVLFVCIERDPLDACVSILDARRKYYSDPDAWWSYVPVEYPLLKDLDPWEQIAGQVHYLGAYYDRELAAVGADAADPGVYQELCGDPAERPAPRLLDGRRRRTAARSASASSRRPTFPFRTYTDRDADKARFADLLAGFQACGRSRGRFPHGGDPPAQLPPLGGLLPQDRPLRRVRVPGLGAVPARPELRRTQPDQDPNGAAFLTIPVSVPKSHDGKAPYSEVGFADVGWKEKHLKTVAQSYRRAPHYDEVYALYERELEPDRPFVELTIGLIEAFCSYLGIETERVRLSDTVQSAHQKTDLIVDICSALGADAYLSGTGGGRDYNDEELLREPRHRASLRRVLAARSTRSSGATSSPGCRLLDLLYQLRPRRARRWSPERRALPPGDRLGDHAPAHRDSLRPEQLGLLALPAGSQPAGGRDDAVRRRALDVPRHRSAHRARGLRLPKPLGQAPVAGHPAGRDPATPAPPRGARTARPRRRRESRREAALAEGIRHYTLPMRLLLVAFYFPPAGGGGVQRTLKFCRHLADLGVEVHVLAPSDPKWFARDEPLLEQIPETTRVHRSRFVGPAASSAPTRSAGAPAWRRVGAEIRYTSSLMLVPDKALPWALTAVPAGIKIVRDHKIDVVMSTSPPASVHLVAEAISACTRRPFVADFRDSWLDNPHRTYDRMSVRAKRAINARMARSVGRRSSAMVAATGAIAQELGHLAPAAAAQDDGDRERSRLRRVRGADAGQGRRFTIVHAGSFFGARSPRPFLEALRTVLDRRPELRGRVRARFLGDLRPEDRAWAGQLGIDGAWEEDGFVPHRDSLAAQRSADALLLLIPHDDGRGDTVLSGKVFEYIASGRPILAAVPPGGVAANLLRSVGAGEVADSDDVAGIADALERLIDRWLAGGLPTSPTRRRCSDRLSRQSRARDLATVLTGVAG